MKNLFKRALRLMTGKSQQHQFIGSNTSLPSSGNNRQSWFEMDRLHLPEVLIKPNGTTHRAVLRVTETSPNYRFELEQFDPPLPPQAPQPNEEQYVTFRCNICDGINTDIARNLVTDREANSCIHCGSSLRLRSVIQALTSEIYGESLTLPTAPVRKSIRGAGMSDWEGYAKPLAKLFAYQNTFYHQKPRLDILNVPESEFGQYDFLISSDVMEHVPSDVDKAFTNMANMLKPGGFLVLTVPYKPDGEHEEFYPDLHEYRFITTGGKTFLYNRTKNGTEQVYDNLVFHGGDGFTLFMRMFSESSLTRMLEASGFDGGIKIYHENDPAHGVIWPISWCLTIVARKADKAG